jgi:hypothetical protein
VETNIYVILRCVFVVALAGTYMKAIGFQQDKVQASVETYADDSSRMIGTTALSHPM